MFRLSEFRFLLPLLRTERAAFLFGGFLVFSSCCFVVAIPRLVGEGISRLESGIRVDLVPGLALAMVGAALLRGITSFWMRTVMIGASRRIENRLRNQLYRHMESLDASYFNRFHTGDLMSRFTSDVEAVRMVVGPGIMYSLNTLFVLTFTLAGMIWVSPRLTIFSLIPLVLLTVAIRVLSPRIHRESMRAQERLAEVSVHAQENFTNSRVVKAFVREDAEVDRMEELSDRYFSQNMRLAHLRAWTNALLWLIGDLLVLFLIGLGGLEIVNGRLGLGEFAAFKGWQFLLIFPMIALGWVMTIFQRGAASARRLRDILEAKPRIDDSLARHGAEVTKGHVRFDGVSFAYAAGKPVLRGIDIDLPAGHTLGVVGPTGSGKTTLLSLIPRLFPVDQGEIQIDGQPLETLPLDALRRRIGYVPQEAFLLSTTVEENIAFATSEASAEAIRQVAALVDIDEEIESFPHGFEERVGERGISLSGGQKQRLALARAILPRPRIVLLDDVLSAVDARTEAQILEGLRAWTADLTTIIVSHRLSSVRHADEIIVLVEGEIIQRGRHDDLVSAPGYYADLYRKQVLEDELESL